MLLTLQIICAVDFKTVLWNGCQLNCVFFVALDLLQQASLHGIQQAQFCILTHEQRIMCSSPLQCWRKTHFYNADVHCALTLLQDQRKMLSNRMSLHWFFFRILSISMFDKSLCRHHCTLVTKTHPLHSTFLNIFFYIGYFVRFFRWLSC